MLPRVIMHNAVSVDGRFDWIEPDLGLFYGIVAGFSEDATLVGSETVLAAYAPGGIQGESDEVEDEAPGAGPDASLPLLAIPDSRGRLRVWEKLLRAGLVDEVSLVVDPSLVGGTSPRSVFQAPDLDSPAGVIKLELLGMERLEGGTVWLHYRVIR